MKEKIYIDFDGTLFDTDRFYQEFLKICLKYKISKEQVDLVKSELFDEQHLFNMERIVHYLIENYHIEKAIIEDVNKLYSSNFVYDDVILCLEKLREDYDLIILTYGNLSYQTKKIDGSNLKKYFQDIIITDKNKATLDTVDYKNSIFIDNNPREIKNFLIANAKKVIRIRRNSDKYSKLDVDALEYKNFHAILEKEFRKDLDNN